MRTIDEKLRGFRERAVACERAANKVRNPEVRATFHDLARQWDEIADQVERVRNPENC
jgi:hypothetical protein